MRLRYHTCDSSWSWASHNTPNDMVACVLWCTYLRWRHVLDAPQWANSLTFLQITRISITPVSRGLQSARHAHGVYPPSLRSRRSSSLLHYLAFTTTTQPAIPHRHSIPLAHHHIHFTFIHPAPSVTNQRTQLYAADTVATVSQGQQTRNPSPATHITQSP